MAEDWAAVAKAINRRIKELGWRQRELADRSNVSLAIVRELQHNSAQRRRSPRTLESLSVTLGWHPQHLAAVAHHRRPPDVDEPIKDASDALWSRLDALERRLDEITDRLIDIQNGLASVIEHVRKAE